MRWIGVHGQRFVAITNLHQMAEFFSTHGGRAGVNLVGQINAEAFGVGTNLGGFAHEPVIAFLVEIATVRGSPESPRITGGQFPAVGNAPEHRQNLDAQLGAEIH